MIVVLIYTWWVVSAQSTHERAYYSEVSIPLGESHAHRLCPPLSMSGRGRLQSKRGRSRIKEEELRRVRISLSRATSGRRDEVYPLPTHARPRVSVSTFERYQGCFQQLKMRQSAGWYWCWIFRRPQETSNSYGCHADALLRYLVEPIPMSAIIMSWRCGVRVWVYYDVQLVPRLRVEVYCMRRVKIHGMAIIER